MTPEPSIVTDAPPNLSFDRDGAQLFAAALDETACLRIEQALVALPTPKPGVRVADAPGLDRDLDPAKPIGAVAATALGPEV